jgi:hypothetical protein
MTELQKLAAVAAIRSTDRYLKEYFSNVTDPLLIQARALARRDIRRLQRALKFGSDNHVRDALIDLRKTSVYYGQSGSFPTGFTNDHFYDQAANQPTSSCSAFGARPVGYGDCATAARAENCLAAAEARTIGVDGHVASAGGNRSRRGLGIIRRFHAGAAR